MRLVSRRMLLCLLALAVWFPLTASAEEPLRVRVLSYNIHHGEGVDGKLDLERIAGIIKEARPDLVSLQEVDRRTDRTDRVDQPEVLARLTGMHVVFEKNIEFGGGEYGNAILSAHPITSHRRLFLPNRDNGEQRGLLVAEVTVDKRPLLFLATHLDHRRGDGERLASAVEITRFVTDAERADRPAVLAGDLNAVRDSRVLAEFTREWAIAGDREQPTIPVAEPRRQIDFVLFRPRAAWKVVEVQVLDEAVASDHRPILAVLELVR